MKKIILVLIMLLVFIPTNVNASNRVKVKFKECVDGDTARFILNKEEIKVRFLAIDTPETKSSTKGEQPYGKEASDYTCKKLKNAKTIELEYDSKSDKTDKYGRYLAWVFHDDKLLQKELVKNGLAKVAYLYSDYKYTDELKKAEESAKKNKKGIYSDIDNSEYTNSKSFLDRISEKLNEFTEKLKSSINNLFSDILNEIL